MSDEIPPRRREAREGYYRLAFLAREEMLTASHHVAICGNLRKPEMSLTPGKSGKKPGSFEKSKLPGFGAGEGT